MLLPMRFRRFIAYFALFLTVTVPTIPASGVQDRADIISSRTEQKQLLPFNQAIRSGRLSNGMEYFLLSHPYPKDTVTLRLIVDAGSVLENETQQGLAHFVEHMAFNGTEEFGEDELIAYLEQLGIQFGPDINAYTSFDETVYRLDLPAGNPESLRTGFRVMEQWARAIAFDADAIDRERGVIVEEWRGGRNAADRILRQHLPVLLADSRYTERLPIGDMDVVRTAPQDEFLDFYRRWYRPDNMAFVAVGDLPVEKLEALVHEYLGPIAPARHPLNRPYFHVPFSDKTRVSVATDEEARRSTVAMYRLQEPAPFQTERDYRNILVRSLFASAVNERLRDIARDPDAPFSQAGVGWNRFLRDTEIAVATAVIRDDRVTDALHTLATELYRVKQHGFLPQEIDRARGRLLQSIDEARVNFESRPSSSLADELVRHWTEGEAVPGIEEEHRLYRKYLPEISLQEVERISRQFTDGEDTIILAGLRVDGDGNLPSGDPVPQDIRLIRELETAANATLTPWTESATPTHLTESFPRPGTILSETEYPDVGTVELNLSNGARVFFKQTDFREDEILFSAVSPGGLSLVDDDLVTAAQLAPSLARASGIGTMDAATLERLLAGRSVSVAPEIGRDTESISGTSRREDLELLFQLVHLTFSNPRFDEVQLENLRSGMVQSIQGRLASPQGQFSHRLENLFAAGDSRLRAPTVQEIEGVQLDQIAEVYRQRFSSPGDFAFFFVGSFDPDEIRSLAVQYLASISDADAGPLETVTDVHAPRPEGTIEEVIRAGTDPVGQTVILFHGPYEWTRKQNHRFNSLVDLLDIRLRERIREQEGGSYSVGAAGWRWRYPQEWAFIQFYYGMDPQRGDELLKTVFDVIDEVRTHPPDETYLERIKARQRESYRQSLRQNNYWLSSLQFFVRHQRDLADILDYPNLIDSLTAEDIRVTAEQFLNPERRIQLMLLPQEQ